MSAAPLDDIVIGESCDDVDMGGTPTAAAIKAMKEWRHTLGSDDDHEDDSKEAPPTTSQSLRFSRWPERDEARSSPIQVAASKQHISNAMESTKAVGEIMAFREYDDDDIDELDILPSQDYAGEAVQRSRSAGDESHRSSQSCLHPWQDYREGTQFHREEESEVFDDVIYTPVSDKPVHVTPVSTLPPQPHTTNLDDDVVDSDSDLSDGFDVPPTIPRQGTSLPPSPRRSRSPSHDRSQRPGGSCASEAAWHTRMSVKRDCSFVDHSPERRSSTNAPDQEVADSSDEFEEKLKLLENDSTSNDDRHHMGSSTAPQSTKHPAATATTASSSIYGSTSRSVVSLGFRPKKKRRRVRQLGIDVFLRVQPSATY